MRAPVPRSPTDDEAALIAAAVAAQANAHAPYSNFKVGAAIRDAEGRIHGGCNVENAAYPQSQCAEAGAIAAMVAAGGRRIAAIVVVGPTNAICAPCGGCRQRIAEFADERTKVVIASPTTVLAVMGFAELLPLSFSAATIAEAETQRE